MPSELARGIAARAWTTDANRNTEMDPKLAEAFAETLDKYIEALRWCSGSEDFGPGGKAEVGWQKVCHPLLNL